MGGEAGQGHGDLGDLLLVDGDAVALLQHLGQKRVEVPPGGAVHAGDELEDEAVGGGTDDGGGHHQVLEEVAGFPRGFSSHMRLRSWRVAGDSM